MPTWNQIHDSIMIFMGIFIGAMPFILLGVFLSALIAKYVKPEFLTKYVPQNKFGALTFATLLGFMFPVCECGNVPVARKLIQKGVKPYVAITFLLSAPVINPVVFFATYIAFKNNLEIFYFRIIFTIIIAFTIGFLFSLVKNQDFVLAKNVSQPKQNNPPKTHSHSFFSNLNSEFFEMTRVLTLGSFIASFFQLMLPRTFVTSLASGGVSSVFAMSILAFITSICSNVDSFFALGFINNFSAGSLLAFLVLGPMLDIKAIVMMTTTFTKKAIFLIAILVTQLTLVLTLFYNLNVS